MKRSFFLSVGLATFLCGCALTWLYFGYIRPNAMKSIPPKLNVEMQRKSLLEGIKDTARACGNGYVQAYELPDGKKLGEGNICYSSFKEADIEMSNWLKKSDAILDRVVPAKQKGVQKSERVVASFPANEFGEKSVTIMWVQVRCIHWISAPDLEYAREFEKSEYNPYKFEE